MHTGTAQNNATPARPPSAILAPEAVPESIPRTIARTDSVKPPRQRTSVMRASPNGSERGRETTGSDASDTLPGSVIFGPYVRRTLSSAARRQRCRPSSAATHCSPARFRGSSPYFGPTCRALQRLTPRNRRRARKQPAAETTYANPTPGFAAGESMPPSTEPGVWRCESTKSTTRQSTCTTSSAHDAANSQFVVRHQYATALTPRTDTTSANRSK
jgi:hypothetical protein